MRLSVLTLGIAFCGLTNGAPANLQRRDDNGPSLKPRWPQMTRGEATFVTLIQMNRVAAQLTGQTVHDEDEAGFARALTFAKQEMGAGNWEGPMASYISKVGWGRFPPPDDVEDAKNVR
ncbi:hypothetical protein F4779DRAFT_623401 [Xylariaceae sp. FL0662B]|nr:hypothetical protein F4779DRAFT_623401 [Xylariaceae sp. FL0662B]